MSNTILDGIKVLDLANENGVFCTKILAEFGAEVIKVEPPQGDSTRYIAPFAGDEPDPEKSTFHAFYNGGKKSITLDIQKEAGRKLFLKLVREADVLVETSKPGTMEDMGLGYEDLKAVCPALIMCSITPFGQTGPYAQWSASSDLIPYAIAGPMFEAGMPGREPLQIGMNFTANMTGVLAVTTIVSLLMNRAESGVGEYMDVSLFDAAATWRGDTPGEFQFEHKILSRQGTQGVWIPMGYYPCKDGFVQFMGSGKWEATIEWMKEQGMDVKGFDDPKFGGTNMYNRNLIDNRDGINALVAELSMKYTKQEFMEESQRRGIPCGASETPASLLKSPHFRTREVFKTVESPVLGTYETMGAPMRFSESELNLGGRAPLLGEHNAEIYGALGLSEEEQAALKQQSVI